MKNLKITSLLVSGLCLLMISGCKRQTIPNPKEPAPTVEKSLYPCSAWRNETGYINLCNELDRTANCDPQACTGNSVTTQLTEYVLINPVTGSPFNFASNQVITPSEQDAVMNVGKSWASAHCPTGYFVSYIDFSPDPITFTGSPTYAGVDITVTYRKCTGGGGPQG